MTLITRILHTFQSGRADNGDPGAIQPSHWNADHDLQLSPALAALDQVAPSANRLPYFVDETTAATTLLTVFARTLLAMNTGADVLGAIGGVGALNAVLTGTPTAPDATLGTNTGQIANTKFVQSAITALINAAPGALDTLKELADAIGDDANFAATITTALAGKQALNANLTALAGLTGAANKVPFFTALATLSLLTVGAAANNLVQLDGAGKLPAVDGSALTGLNFDPTLSRGMIDGLIPSNNVADATNKIDISVGVATAADVSAIMKLTSALTKNISTAWAVGSGNGGLDTGTIADGGYYIWLIQRSDTGVVDALVSLSGSAPTMPTNYNRKRVIGWVHRLSGAIRAFIWRGDSCWFKVPTLDVSTTLGTSATSFALNLPASSTAILNVHHERSSTTSGVLVYSPDLTDAAVSDTAAPLSSTEAGVAGATLVVATGQVTMLVDASSQIRAVAIGASTNFRVAPVGFVFPRGKNA
jgi:hypothetical protein